MSRDGEPTAAGTAGADRATAAPWSRDAVGESEVSVADLIAICYRRRKLILSIALAGVAIAVAWSLLTPKMYRAQTKIVSSSMFSPRGEAGALSALRGTGGTFGLDFLSPGTSPTNIYPDMLASREVLLQAFAEPLPTREGKVDPLDYFRVAGSDRQIRLEYAATITGRRLIASNFDFRTGITTAQVVAGDPVIAAAFLNACVDALGQQIRALKTGQAEQQVRFIERRLSQVSDSLAMAEEDLKRFRERNRLVSGSPELMLEEARHLRALTTSEQVYLTLRSQLEIAQIERQRNTSDLVVVERAAPPVLRSSPRRSLAVVIGGLVSGAVGLVAAFVAESGGRWRAAIAERLRNRERS